MSNKRRKSLITVCWQNFSSFHAFFNFIVVTRVPGNETLTELTPPDESILTEGSLPDSEIMEMDSKEIENLKLREMVETLKEQLSKKTCDKIDDLDVSIGMEENENELRRLEEKVEEITREREDQLMAKNEQIEEIEAIREDEKNKWKEKEGFGILYYSNSLISCTTYRRMVIQRESAYL